jgi:hypothetical protein
MANRKFNENQVVNKPRPGYGRPQTTTNGQPVWSTNPVHSGPRDWSAQAPALPRPQTPKPVLPGSGAIQGQNPVGAGLARPQTPTVPTTVPGINNGQPGTPAAGGTAHTLPSALAGLPGIENLNMTIAGSQQSAQATQSGQSVQGGVQGGAVPQPAVAGGQNPQDNQWYQYAQQMMEQINNRQPFEFDLNGSALYQMYKDQYLRNGQLAMQDTMGQAAGLTGGYGSSYAQNVGQQAYNGYLSQLNEQVPEIYAQERAAYNDELDALYDRWNLANQMYLQDLDRQRYDQETAYDRQQAQISQALDMWNLTGYANEFVASVLGVPVGTPTGSMAQYLNDNPMAGIVPVGGSGTGSVTGGGSVVGQIGGAGGTGRAQTSGYVHGSINGVTAPSLPTYDEWLARMEASQAAAQQQSGGSYTGGSRPTQTQTTPKPTGTTPKPTSGNGHSAAYGQLASYFTTGESLPANYTSQVTQAYQSGAISRAEANQLLAMSGKR